MLYADVPFLNVDEIQTEDRAFAHPVAAGRELVRRLDEVEHRRESFAVETTMSSRMYAKRMKLWRTWAYRIRLHFIVLPSEDYAVQRVAIGVAAGGHDVLEADVRRQFRRGLALFDQVFKPLVDEWYHWHSDDGGLRLGQHHRR